MDNNELNRVLAKTGQAICLKCNYIYMLGSICTKCGNVANSKEEVKDERS